MREKVSIFWFRRDLRLHDNTGLNEALRNKKPLVALFIYDEHILNDLSETYDRRVDFISQALLDLHLQLKACGSALLAIKDRPDKVFSELTSQFDIHCVYANHDYEPYAIGRDVAIREQLLRAGIEFKTFKDQCIFEKNEVLKSDNTPYTVFTPYSKRWKQTLSSHPVKLSTADYSRFHKFTAELPSLEKLGFKKTDLVFRKPDLAGLSVKNYKQSRDIPALDATTHLSVHLRFGTVSIREVLKLGLAQNETFVNELIWRDFFMMILFHFPEVVGRCFKKQYEKIKWRNHEKEFLAWKNGETGYPLVDAGMRELSATGFMHNRARMVCASFLIKHLLIDWRWGEAHFAALLNDYDLSANNGNWQWAAGCGCDAAPYFRIFNPTEQQKKFDREFRYVKKWVPEFGSGKYTSPIVDHVFARTRALETYKNALK